jgi:hypothetical protein
MICASWSWTTKRAWATSLRRDLAIAVTPWTPSRLRATLLELAETASTWSSPTCAWRRPTGSRS